MFLNVRFRIVLFTALAPVCALAQASVPTEWDVKKMVEAIASQSERFQPLVMAIDPKAWISRGAPEAYVQQWESAKAQAETLKLSSGNLVREPAKLTAALDTFFRLQNLEVSLTSLIDGVRKYQNPALADLLQSVLSENSTSRQQLRQYLVDLAALKEQEFKVMEEEAQRCRTAVTRPSSAAPERKKSGK